MGFENDLATARTGRADPSRQGRPATTDMHGGQRTGRQRRNDLGHGLQIREFEVGRVVQIDVGLADAIDQQQPATRPLFVSQQFDLATDRMHSADTSDQRGDR